MINWAVSAATRRSALDDSAFRENALRQGRSWRSTRSVAFQADPCKRAPLRTGMVMPRCNPRRRYYSSLDADPDVEASLCVDSRRNQAELSAGGIGRPAALRLMHADFEPILLWRVTKPLRWSPGADLVVEQAGACSTRRRKTPSRCVAACIRDRRENSRQLNAADGERMARAARVFFSGKTPNGSLRRRAGGIHARDTWQTAPARDLQRR